MVHRIGKNDAVFGFVIKLNGKLSHKEYAHAGISPIYSHSRLLGDMDSSDEGTALVTVVVDQLDRAHIIGCSVICELEGWPVIGDTSWGDLPTKTTVKITEELVRICDQRRQAADEKMTITDVADDVAACIGTEI